VSYWYIERSSSRKQFRVTRARTIPPFSFFFFSYFYFTCACARCARCLFNRAMQNSDRARTRTLNATETRARVGARALVRFGAAGVRVFKNARASDDAKLLELLIEVFANRARWKSGMHSPHRLSCLNASHRSAFEILPFYFRHAFHSAGYPNHFVNIYSICLFIEMGELQNSNTQRRVVVSTSSVSKRERRRAFWRPPPLMTTKLKYIRASFVYPPRWSPVHLV